MTVPDASEPAIADPYAGQATEMCHWPPLNWVGGGRARKRQLGVLLPLAESQNGLKNSAGRISQRLVQFDKPFDEQGQQLMSVVRQLAARQRGSHGEHRLHDARADMFVK